jgi:excinuclease UvrABC nuclease subunit
MVFMTELQSAKQIWLLAYENPLKSRFGASFFKAIPQEPGVYFMTGQDGGLLYIGKAKNLRNRLRSYQHVRPDQASRKVLRLVGVIANIRWEICESEQAALLRENYLLRTFRPPFNVLNTHPEAYFFIGFRSTSHHLHFRLTTSPTPQEDELYGAFKGRGLIKRGYSALLRLLWAALSSTETNRFDFPGVLVRRRGPENYGIFLGEELAEAARRAWASSVRRFLKGTSKKILTEITEKLLTREDILPFMYNMIQEDLETLGELFTYGPHRNSRLRKYHGLTSHLVAQEKIDDLLVTYWKKSS